MNRLVKLCIFSAIVVAGSVFSAPKAAEAGYGYGYGHSYGHRSYYRYTPSYYAPTYYAPTYYAPSYNYGGFCY